MKPVLAAGLLVLLAAACQAPVRLAVPPAPVGAPVAVGFATVEVRDVSLPAYAEEGDVFVREEGGALAAAGAVWADDPARALTLDLVRALNDLTPARVAGEPWPFDEPAEARLDVRVADLAADEAAGAFLLTGQYYVGAFDGSGRDRAGEFRIEVPLPPEGDLGAVAAARGQATVLLAREVAERGLR